MNRFVVNLACMTALAHLLGCLGDMAAPQKEAAADFEYQAKPSAVAPGRAGGAAPPSPKRMASKSKKMDAFEGLAEEMAPEPESPMDDAVEKGGKDEAPARAWFPETFLFEPLVETGADGTARFSATVPDRLTTWRVLALAHTRGGAQAGAVTSFLGTLDAYVDPVLPSFFTAGDRVRLPIQVVNTTEKVLSERLTVRVGGGRLTSPASLPVRVGPQSSAVLYAEIDATRSGALELQVALGNRDAVKKSVPVRAFGRPVTVHKSGTLAAPREVTLEGPDNMDPSSAQVRLTVFPGALSVLRSELASASRRGGVADDAYALLLAGRGAQLLKALGDEPDPDALRTLGIVSTQRVIRSAVSPGFSVAVLQAEAALAHPDNPILSRLGERLVGSLQRWQRPDGTFGGGNGWTLQRLMVATAEATRAARAATTPEMQRGAAATTLRANFAFERHFGQIDDGYTAATILASGAVTGSLAERLQKLVREAVKTSSDGSRYLPVDDSVVRTDGVRPSVAEATAMAVLALADDSAATWRADLGATLLSNYVPSRGWGDGRANLVCLRAVLELFDDPIPPGVRITLDIDGQRVTEGQLDAKRLRDTVVLTAPAPTARGKHVWTVRADPPLAGLGYALALRAWVPWEETTADGGLDLKVELPDKLRVAVPTDVNLQAIAPAGRTMVVRWAYPAGVQLDPKSLDALIGDSTITRYEIEDGLVSLWVPQRRQGQPFNVKVRAIATLGGSLVSAASSVELEGSGATMRHIPPKRWVIK